RLRLVTPRRGSASLSGRAGDQTTRQSLDVAFPGRAGERVQRLAFAEVGGQNQRLAVSKAKLSRQLCRARRGNYAGPRPKQSRMHSLIGEPNMARADDIEAEFPPGVKMPSELRRLCDYLDRTDYPISGYMRLRPEGEGLKAWFGDGSDAWRQLAGFGAGPDG